MYRVIFRTCDTVHSLHNAPRPFGLDKRGVITLCFRSLLRALDGYPHTIHIIADNISDELRQFFLQYSVTMTEGTFGNDNSIRESLKQVDSYPDADWVYLVEDDYLHTRQAFLWIDDLIRNRESILLTKPKHPLTRWMLADWQGRLDNHPLVIHPPDYPDRYRPRDRKRSLIFISQHCHWRQIANTTFTFLAEAGTCKRFARTLEAAARGAKDGYLSRKLYARSHFFGKALCVSPIPGVSTHMHDGVMTPLVDWAEVKAQMENL